MTRNIPSRAARAAAITVMFAALSAGASALNTAVLGGLDSPRGLAVGPAGRLIYAEGSGAISERQERRHHAVARLKPRVVPWQAGLPFGPPAGTMVPSEDVATPVTVGADGFYYVGELRGVPATPGTSQVWRIAPDSVNALCDPANPNAGACRRYADGFTSIVDLEAGPDGISRVQ